MKSLLSRIILGVCAFLALLTVFLPYAQIPGVDAKTEFDVENNKIQINIGKDVTTYNFTTAVTSGGSYEFYNDEEYSDKVDFTKLPLETGKNTFYMKAIAMGSIAGGNSNALADVIIGQYTVLIDRGGADETTIAYDNTKKLITISTSGSVTTLDFSTLISSTEAWQVFSDKAMTSVLEASNLTLKNGDNLFYAAITLPGATADTYVPLNTFAMTVNRDALHQTKPIISEFGLQFKKSQDSKYTGDAMIFLAMAFAAVVILGSFLLPSKFRIIQLVLSGLFAAFLIAIPVMEMPTLIDLQYEIAFGLYANILVGVLIIAAAIFNFMEERKQYKIDKKHLEEIHSAQ